MANTRRLNISLPVDAANDLEELAQESGSNMKEVIRTALGLVKIAHEAKNNKQKLVVADANGTPIKEIVLPR